MQAPCYSGRCPAEGARELPEERVHTGKPPSASAAGKGASCNLCTLVECTGNVSASWFSGSSCEQVFWTWAICRLGISVSFIGESFIFTAKFSLKSLG